MKKFLSVVLSLVLAFTLLVSCSSKSEVKDNSQGSASIEKENVSNTFKIGGIGPITGGAAVYGLAIKNGIQIAVDEINTNGGINGFNIDYRFADDEHDAEKSVNAYNSLKDWGMQLLIGTTTSSPCIAVAEKTYRDNMFQITPSGSAVECAANPNVFRVCFSDPNQGIASADYIDKYLDVKKVGIIYDSSDVYSTGIYEKFMEQSVNKNFDVVCEESFTADSKTDFTTQLRKIKNAGADLLFLPFYYLEASLVLNQANQIGFKPIIFSCDGMDGILTLDNFDTSLAEGVMLLTPFSADDTDPKVVNFVNKYKNLYNEVPNQFAADAYDAVYILKQAIEYANLDPNNSISDICTIVEDAMVNIEYNGVTGKNVRWSKEGEPNKDPKAVVIENGAYKLHNN